MIGLSNIWNQRVLFAHTHIGNVWIVTDSKTKITYDPPIIYWAIKPNLRSTDNYIQNTKIFCLKVKVNIDHGLK